MFTNEQLIMISRLRGVPSPAAESVGSREVELAEALGCLMVNRRGTYPKIANNKGGEWWFMMVLLMFDDLIMVYES